YGNLSCRDGAALGCRFLNRGCAYQCAAKRAKDEDLVCTNYHYWIGVNDRAGGLGDKESPVELLVLDEGHSAPEVLSDYLSVKVYESEINRWVKGNETGDGLKEWKDWINESTAQLELEEEMNELESKLEKSQSRAKQKDLDKLRNLSNTYDKFGRIL